MSDAQEMLRLLKPALRGTARAIKSSTSYRKPSYQTQINKLKRQVAHNKRELVRHTIDGTLTPAGTGLILTQIAVTGDIKNAATFRDDITGSKWRNVYMDVSCKVPSDFTGFRMIVYVPKKPGQRFSPATQAFTKQLDPNFAWTVADQRYTPDTMDNRVFRTRVNLKSLKTIYNDDLSVLEKGEVVVLFIHQGSTTSYDYSIQAMIRNI